MPNPYARSGHLPPPKLDPKALEEAKKKAEAEKQKNAERIAAIALGEDPNKKPVAAAEAKPVVAPTEEPSREDEEANRALDAVEGGGKGKGEDEDDDEGF